MLKNTRNEYGSIAKLFHWLIFLCVFGMLIAGYLMDDITNKVVRSQIVNIHKLVGLTILFLVVLRVMWALMNLKPMAPEGATVLEHRLSQSVHVLLYVVLILMPISGWIMSVTAGRPPRIDNHSINLPLQVNKLVSSRAFAVHSWIAILIIGLVSLHIFAALYHHYIKKDNVLKRMWPWKI